MSNERRTAADATLHTLADVRKDARVSLQTALATALQRAEGARARVVELRAKWRKLQDAQERDDTRALAGTLQRRAQCQVALRDARTQAASEVRQALAEQTLAEAEVERAQAAVGAAHADEMVVQRHLAQRAEQARAADDKREQEESDELAQRL